MGVALLKKALRAAQRRFEGPPGAPGSAPEIRLFPDPASRAAHYA
jgi:hypothetical protein